MKFSKSIALFLTATQMVGFTAFASPSATNTPELNLVQNVLALQGMKLSQNALQSQLQSALSQYYAQATQDGQEQVRLGQALVDLGVYTQAQANTFVAQAQVAGTRVASNAGNASSMQASMATEIQNLAGLHPTGAQYSGCGAVDAAAGVLLVGGVATVVTGVILDRQRTDLGTYPNRGEGNTLITLGAIAAGVGAIVAIVDAGC
jgi:hypothetical protein